MSNVLFCILFKILVIVSLFKKNVATSTKQPQLRGLTTIDSSELPPPGIEHRPTTDVKIEAAVVDYCLLHSQNWIVYSGTYYNSVIGSNTGISSSSYTSSKNGWTVGITGVPNYDRTFTAANIAALNSRPKASTDFRSGATTAVANTWYAFGADIGYQTKSCSLGYWPPGPVCPTAQSSTNGVGTFPISPALETGSGCYAFGASPGVYVTGVPLWSWSDANSYNSANVWHNLALSFEPYDMDICMGHAANGQYHHHGYSPCIAEKLGDMGQSHSPIYGFAADGYPMYGPYQAAQTLATPCWKARDYSGSATGCGTSGTRTCVFNNPEDITQGTKTVVSGPSITGTVLSLSSNTIYAVSGIYFEDYYLDTTCANLAGPNIYLDKNNGHDHGDSLGYHYHITTNKNGDGVFPYGPGPKFHGCLPSTTTCCSTYTMSGGSGGPPSGGPPSGGSSSNGLMSGQGCTSGTSVCAATTTATTAQCSSYTAKLTTTPLQGPSSPPTIGPPTLAPASGSSSSGGTSGASSSSGGPPPPPPSSSSSSGSTSTTTLTSTSVTAALSTSGATLTNALAAAYPGIQVSNPSVTAQSGGTSVSVTQNIPAGVTLAQASAAAFLTSYAQAVSAAANVPTTSIAGLTATQGRRLLAGVNMAYTIINLSASSASTSSSGSSSSAGVASSSSSGGSGCFIGSEMVQLASGEHKSMEEVQIGDHILTINAKGEQVFSPVVYKPYGHNERRTVFTTITTELGRDLTMTSNHMLPAGDCSSKSTLSFVAAADVAVGNCIQTVNGHEQIVSIKKIEGKGIYTVIAMEALIVVNGIVATPFGGINPTLANIYYNLHRLIYASIWDKSLLSTGTSQWLKVALVEWWAVMTSF